METLCIKHLPSQERPQERLILYGASHLSNAELLSVILRSGTKEANVLQLSHSLLSSCDGLKGLRNATLEELAMIKGIGRTKGVTILALIELAHRLALPSNQSVVTIRSPEDGATLVMEEMRHLQQEHFIALFLNTKNHVIARKTIFIGSLNSSIVHPRELFREAVKRAAASIICIHNHPSGVRLGRVA